MGKASRLKADRAAQRQGLTPQQEPLTAEQELSAAVIVVGELFGIEPDCAGAGGLLAEVGLHLGHDLRPRAVSAIIRDKKTSTLLAMGPKATEKFSYEQLERMENHRPDGKDNGHLVLTSEEHSLLLDPNMRQLGAVGVEAPSIIIRVRSTEPESGEWEFTNDGLDIVYLLDEDNRTLFPRFEDGRSEGKDYAKTIALGIQAGLSLGEIVAQVRRG